MTAAGGVMYVPQIAVPQIVYLDFDGELTRYNGEILSLDRVEVADSLLTADRIADIVAELNTKYVSQNVVFVTERPENAEYSTIYVGKTDAFNNFGSFAGLAETIDKGNRKTTDNAFVMLDSTSSNEAIIATISHETDHLLGTLDHGGEGLAPYATIHYYDETYTGTLNGGLTVSHAGSSYYSSGGDTPVYHHYDVASNVTVTESGEMVVLSGGRAFDLNIRGAVINYAGGGIERCTVNSSGYLYVYGGYVSGVNVFYKGEVQVSGGSVSSVHVKSGGYVSVTGGVLQTIVLSSGGRMAVNFSGHVKDIHYNGGSIEIGNALGAISVSAGDRISFYGNSTYSGGILKEGGAIYCAGSFFAGNAVSFTFNSALNGGAICNPGTVGLGSGAVFSSNFASRNGGAVAGRFTSLGAGAVFYRNSALRNGGAVEVTSSGNWNIGSSAVFSGNCASLGGAMGIGNSARVSLGDGVSFISNFATSAGGGGIYNGGSLGIGNGGVWSGNSGAAGGGIYGWFGDTVIGGSAKFVNNSAVSNGGAIYANGSNRIGDSAVFSFNSAACGGAAYFYGTTMTTIGSNASFCNNSAGSHGGGLYLYSSGITIGDSAVFFCNTAGSHGGAVMNQGNMIFGDSAVFSGNSAALGGALYESAWSATFGKDTLFTANSAVRSGGAILNGMGGTIEFDGKTVFRGNMAAEGGAIYNDRNGKFILQDADFATVSDSVYNLGEITVNGNVSFAGAVVCAKISGTAYYGKIINNGNIEFNVAERTTGMDVLFNDAKGLAGNGAFSITVSANQAAGAYKLIGNAAAFNKTISLNVGSVEDCGLLTVGGAAVSYGGKSYSLVCSDSTLALSVEAASVPPVPSSGTQVKVYSRSTLVRQGTVLTGETIVGTQNDKMLVHSGGTAVSTTLNLSGSMYVSGGGRASNTHVSNGGIAYILGEEYAPSADFYPEALHGTAGNLFVSSGGRAHISGGEVTNLLVSSGGSVYLGGLDDIAATDVYGKLYSGEVKSGGSLTIGYGGVELWENVIFGGTVTVDGWADVYGNVAFDITERTVADQYIVDNIAGLNWAMS
ncbi:MAG: hypothetical protein J6S73_07680, partial [Lentisphaeria bacterium]|nr:hypothetical protein [Lentisphaeria bacterium]